MVSNSVGGGFPWGKRRTLPLLATVLLSACYSYEALPQDRLEIFEELQQMRAPVDPLGMPNGTAEEAWTKTQAAGWAVSHNPTLLAIRKQMGIAEAELVEAGLLPDPEIGWDSMNVVAEQVVGNTARAPDYIAGLGLMWQIPRPGEISSKVGMAEARKEEIRQRILEAEWSLVREVHMAWLTVLGAQARLRLNSKVLDTAKKVSDFFQEARKVLGATALQANLATIDYSTLLQDRVRLEGDLKIARQNLNAVLGLRPDTQIPMRVEENPFLTEDEHKEADALTKEALEHRPDLEALFARYRALEEQIRLEVARQWPNLALGTAFSLVLPIFSSFNGPAIRTAMARRDRMAQRLRSAVHALRAEVHTAVTEFENERRQVQAYKTDLIPRIEENLRLTQVAFRAREVTLVEILTAQRQSLGTQKNYLEARIRKAVARLMMDTASGAVLLTEKDSREPSDRVKDADEAKEAGR